MASLFRERRTLTKEKDSTIHSNGTSRRFSFRSDNLSLSPVPPDLANPFGELSGGAFTDQDLRETAYEIFVSACRTTASRPLSRRHQPPPAERSPASSSSSSSFASPASGAHRSLTSTAASKMKKALGLRSSSYSSFSSFSSPSWKVEGSPSPSSGGKGDRRSFATLGELVRVQMGISEQMDSRIRKGLLRISAVQLGRRVETMVLPLELLQQFKASDFPSQQEYEAWQARNLKVLEVGLLLHPHLPLGKSDISAQRLRQIIRSASDKPLETGKNSESMQVLRSAVMALACRSFDGSAPEVYHWADGFPFNLYLYQMLLQTCFESSEEGSIIEEIDDLMEQIKKTWVILGINQTLHNLCFTWALFQQFVATGQVDADLLFAADAHLEEVAKDAKATKDPVYSKHLSSTLTSILGWTEKRLLAYHDTFNAETIDLMHCIVSLGVSTAKILVEDISNEYRRRRREEVDVARTRIETYIRSSIRTAFAQRMELADSSRRSSRGQTNPSPVLCILASDIGELANKEKELFSPILKKWHPLAAGIAVATLHSCYRNELKQFISGVTELTQDAVQVLRAADKLEQDLVQIAVEDSVDSEDGGKAIIREMPPYEAELTITNLERKWIKTRVDRLREWIDRSLQQEAWNPKQNEENIVPSALEILRIVDEIFTAFFQLPIPVHTTLVPDLIVGLDRSLQHYISKAKMGCGTKNTFMPALPALTRCEVASKFQGTWKKKEKPRCLPKLKSQVGTVNVTTSSGLPQITVRMNTLHHIRTALDNSEKHIITKIRNSESALADVVDGLNTSFELSQAACQEGIHQLCETTAYKLIFHDLSHVLWDSLYFGDTSTSRIAPFLKELNKNLDTITSTVHPRVRNRLVTTIMKVSFDGFLLVLLAGGPSRAFTRQDSQILEEDFRSLRDLFLADGDGLPQEVVDKASIQVRNILPLFRTDTEGLVERFKHMIIDSYGSAAKTKLPLPPTSGNWSPSEANTVLRVLCYRYDDTASKFLKKTYSLPKKI